METTITPKNWYDVFEYNEEIKSVTQEISGFYSRILGSGKADKQTLDNLEKISLDVTNARDELMSNKRVFKSEQEVLSYTDKLNTLWHHMDGIEKKYNKQ